MCDDEEPPTPKAGGVSPSGTRHGGRGIGREGSYLRFDYSHAAQRQAWYRAKLSARSAVPDERDYRFGHSDTPGAIPVGQAQQSTASLARQYLTMLQRFTQPLAGSLPSKSPLNYFGEE